MIVIVIVKAIVIVIDISKICMDALPERDGTHPWTAVLAPIGIGEALVLKLPTPEHPPPRGVHVEIWVPGAGTGSAGQGWGATGGVNG